ncbi:SDR family NAD(P)-dependent oxidoreductase [Flavilitoribacter nigricans]|uniref:Short-chain dehydrogenase n=1 Tax=Flavilitoribacter nigricans (strain ATCC 23147 / DSM 23189 / NBRC 102662 / NCIMB 1420 / SS-2) TaxID=1122177 RepID=A0A2D0N8X5_FLAN2|nr:SDR family oxidoreductase [Flavilitoribacter nigricans]PHN04925.1 short-chain dehydrogenase [Flavilitoribacter nigricans DSM 23189 = NBRC 102662]
MNRRFIDQVAIVTGAAAGIGFEIARQLAREGAFVILNDVDAEQAVNAAARISSEYRGHCLPLPGDAGSLPVIQALVDHAIDHFGRVDMVVANAGLTLFADFFEFSPADFQRIMNLNLQGAFFLTQAAARQMKRQATGGRILLMSSNIGQRAYPYLTAYSMTKAAISTMARSLVLELSPHGININAIAPGATLTERTELEDPAYAEVWSERIPIGKVGMPADMAAPALFLLSGDARHITGQTVVVDGGWSGVSNNPEVVIHSQLKK